MLSVDQSKPQTLIDYLNDRRDVYESFTRQSGFEVAFGERAAFDHKNQKVIIGVDQLEKLQVTQNGKIVNSDMLDWIVFHELGHFLQLKNNPQKYKEFIKEGNREDGFGRVAFEFYNCCLDVHTNKNIANTHAIYREGTKVDKFYLNQLFPDKDLSKAPLCQQFSYLILLSGMGIADEYKFSDEIPNDITGPGRRDFSIEKFSQTFLAPNKEDIKVLKYNIDTFLKPIWESLLKKDIEEGRAIEVNEELIDGEFTEEDCDNIRRILDDRNKDASQRDKENSKKQLDESLPDVSEQTKEDFFIMLTSISGIVQELVAVWNQIVTPIERLTKEEVNQQTSGHVDLPSVIKRYGSLEEENPQVFIRIRFEHEITYQPKEIDFYLTLDLSGSMSDSIQSLKKALVSIAASIISFNEASLQNELGVKINFNLVGYNDSAFLIMNGTPTIRDLVIGFDRLVAENGTASHTGYQQVLELLNTKTSDEERVNILLEVTDGDTSDPKTSKRLLNQIQKKDVVTGGIKFTGSINSDFQQDRNFYDGIPQEPITGSFKEIWGNKGREISHIGQLTKAIKKFLEGVLSDDKF